MSLEYFLRPLTPVVAVWSALNRWTGFLAISVDRAIVAAYAHLPDWFITRFPLTPTPRRIYRATLEYVKWDLEYKSRLEHLHQHLDVMFPVYLPEIPYDSPEPAAPPDPPDDFLPDPPPAPVHEADVFVAPAFGPEFRGDNSGDGPENDPKLSDYQKYDPDDYKSWSRSMIALLPDRMGMLYTQGYPARYPTSRPDRENFNSEEEYDEADKKYHERKKKWEDVYDKNNRDLYRVLYSSVMGNPNARALLDTVQVSDGVKAWKKLDDFHMQSSSQTKLAAVAEFLSAHQQSDETPLQFKTRLQKAQDRVDDLNIRFSDVTVSRFLTGLSSEYDGFRNAMIAANKDYTLDELYQQLLQYQSAVAISEDSVKAHVARKSPGKSSSSSSLSSSSSPTESPVTADAARILAETFANFLNGSAKGGQNRKRKRGDQSSKPKQKYCDHCKMSGHWTSECRKLQAERSNSNEKSKSKDQGDKKNNK